MIHREKTELTKEMTYETTNLDMLPFNPSTISKCLYAKV
jgi:hypothetical protein